MKMMTMMMVIRIINAEVKCKCKYKKEEICENKNEVDLIVEEATNKQMV